LSVTARGVRIAVIVLRHMNRFTEVLGLRVSRLFIVVVVDRRGWLQQGMHEPDTPSGLKDACHSLNSATSKHLINNLIEKHDDG
jgi:hypothetical protein